MTITKTELPRLKKLQQELNNYPILTANVYKAFLG
jgi:hypothetical protein